MLPKESKIRILETFYALDYTFFGKPVAKVETCCPIFVEEYISVKGALLSVVIEMLRLLRHSPKPIAEKVSTKKLLEMAKASAKIARENSKKLVVTEKGKQDVKAMVRETIETAEKGKKVDLEKVVQEKIRQKAFSLAVDNLIVGRCIPECKSVKKLSTWEGKIIEDAYKILRDNLVESALSILEEK